MAVRIKWNHKAFRQIRHAYGPLVKARAEAAAADLPEGYEVVYQNDPTTQRPRAYIVAAEPSAQRDEAENSTLLKKISSMRGS